MKKSLYTLMILLGMVFAVQGQRQMETLDRGVVAVKVANGVFLSWRLQGYEWYGVTFNIYRGSEKLNDVPLKVSNFTDASGTLTSEYSVKAVVNGVEEATGSKVVTPLAQQYKDVALKARPSTYEINDITTADLDGDGEYELIVKRICKGWNENNTSYSYLEAYKQNGTFLWEINVGPNILPDVEINIAAFDFDEDGKAEVYMRSSEGTIFGDGKQIGDVDADGKTNYRSVVSTTANMQYMTVGPEFLSLINGETGAELDRVDFIPRGLAKDWGDDYGHRCSKYFFGAPYLDGKKPSLFIGRGIYTKTIMRTYDVVNKKLVFKWEFNSGTSGVYFAQGNHNYTIADIDMDGRDEIEWGSMTVDENGKGLYSTDFGHGDAMHVGDLDPYHKGAEIFKCIEDAPNFGTSMWDGATGEILIHHYTTSDCGRCCAANISDEFKGTELWGGSKMFSATTRKQVGTGGGPENYRIYWDGDLLEEMTDHSSFSTTTGAGFGAIFKYVNGATSAVLNTGVLSCNYTKGTPCLQADLFGDWREEVIWRSADNQSVRIYTTIDPTIYRNYTLMHDHQYRQAICWQMCGYNQPPHVSYFLGEAEGLTVPPPPTMSNNRYVYAGSGTWDTSTSEWVLNGATVAYADGGHALFDVSKGTDVSVALNSTVSPSMVTVNSPGNYTINASSGKLTGTMGFVKQGEGALTLNGIHDYSGDTEVWGGLVNFNGELQNSPVWLRFFAKMAATGKLLNGVTLRYGAALYPGGVATSDGLVIGGGLTIEEGGSVVLDLKAPADETDDLIVLNGNLILNAKSNITINPILTDTETKLAAGEYSLMNVSGILTGDLSKVVIKGIEGIDCYLKFESNKLILVINAVREATSLLWNGGLNENAWDVNQTSNFLTTGATVFIPKDTVTFNETATSKIVNLMENVYPASVVVAGSSSYTFDGEGMLSGATTLTKTGTGTLVLNDENQFTGKVLISEGVLEVNKMPSFQDLGAIGGVSSDPTLLEINGGTLRINGDDYAKRACTIGANGGTIDNNGKLYYFEKFTGGVLTKTGAGQLVLSGVNTHSKTILKEGSIYLLNDETNPGATISFQGGDYLKCFDNSYSYNYLNWNIEVLSSYTGNIYMDSRGYYTGKLTGEGVLNVYFPYSRADLYGNWSAFTGTINFISSSSNGGDCRFANTAGYEKAAVNIGAKVYAYHINSSAVKLGSLSGTGVMSGSHNWEIGALNTDFTFAGTFTGTKASIYKVGTGTMTLSGANTYTGVTLVKAGTLYVSNTTGSATGTGAVTVQSGASLAGNGILASAVKVLSGGYLYPGTTTVGSSLTVGSCVMNAGSVLHVKTNSLFLKADKVVATTSFQAAGQLVLEKTNTADYAVGNSFLLVSSPSITGSFTSVSPETPGDGLAWDLSEFTTTGKIKVIKATGIGNSIKAESLSLYPNPTSGKIYLNLPAELGSANVTIETMNGQIVFQGDYEGTSNVELDLTSYNKGIYIIRALTTDRLLVGKVILK